MSANSELSNGGGASRPTSTTDTEINMGIAEKINLPDHTKDRVDVMQWRAIVTVHEGIDEASGIVCARQHSVGLFTESEQAWLAAAAMCERMGGYAYTIKQVSPVSDDDDRCSTIEDAKRLVRELERLVDADVQGAVKERLQMRLELLRKTLITGWTEVDESLFSTTMAIDRLRRHASAAPTEELTAVLKGLTSGAGLLHRWQGREGRIGNVR
jgi:hypothetical protein